MTQPPPGPISSPHLPPGLVLPDAADVVATTLPGRWSAWWRRRPSAPLLHPGTTDRRSGDWLTAGEVDERTAAAAVLLWRQGLEPGDRLLWSARPSVPAVLACVAALRAGAVVVPVNPAATAREIAQAVGDVRPALAVVDGEDAAAAVHEASQGSIGVLATDLVPLHLPLAGRPRARGGGASSRSLDAARPEDPALIVFTSGTTGTPKGAVLRHANLSAGVSSLHLAWDWTSDDRLVLALPLFHVHGLCAGLFGSLTAGGGAVLVWPFQPGAVVEAAAAHRATMFFGVPTMYHRLLGHGGAADLRRLRLCVSGSAPLAPALWQRLREEASLSVLERYGMSETLLTLSNPLAGERRPGTVGFPLPWVEARLTDGELEVRGPTVFGGYWERPAANAEAFDVGGWFRTGDGADRDEQGYFRILGRRGDVVISGGHNVYPAEVEDVLLTHPSVAEVAVVGTPSEEWGEEVTAFIVTSGGPLPREEIEALVAGQLAAFKRPRILHQVDELPRNAMGKVRRDLLR